MVVIGLRVTLVIHGGSVPEKSRVYWKRVKRKTYNNSHFNSELAPEFFDAKFIICITFSDKLEDGSMQALKFDGGQNTDYAHDTEMKPWIVTRVAYTVGLAF